jgi:hypothetical protein
METQIVEINGVKLEIDLRHAKVVHENIRVGTKVKVLIKQGQYGSKDSKVFPGVVVGFEPFRELPTIVVCYLEHDWSNATLQFAYINATTSEKYDIIISYDDDLPVNKASTLAKLDRDIEKKREEIREIELKREYFLLHFNRYFNATVPAEPPNTEQVPDF